MEDSASVVLVLDYSLLQKRFKVVVLLQLGCISPVELNGGFQETKSNLSAYEISRTH